MDMPIRVIALIDMDAFYTQVEEREQPHLRGRPLAVVPFSRGTTITGQAIAVNYPARAFGVKRGMDCNEMRRLCPIIHLCRVPAIEGVEKGDISKYRDASAEIFKVLVEFSERIIVEKASVDEAFLDLTEECEIELETRSKDEWVEKLSSDVAQMFPCTFLVDETDKQQTVIAEERLNSLKQWLSTDCHRSRQQLAIAVGASIVERIRKCVKEVTQFNCSAGISHNKILAKLVCARHKPACQSVIVPQHIQKLYEQTPINSVRNLGGKFGKRLMRQFNAEMMSELRGIPREVLLQNFHPKNVDWLVQLLEGENDEPVCSNLQPKSLGTSKQFAGAAMLTTVGAVKKWVHALSNELSKRLVADDDKYGRVAQTLVVGFSTAVGEHNVRTMHLPNYTTAAIQQTCWNFMKPFNREKDGHSWYPHVSCLYMSASRFEIVRGLPTRRITEFFHRDCTPPAGEHNDEGTSNCSDNDDDEVIFVAEINARKECDNEATTNGPPAAVDNVGTCNDKAQPQQTVEDGTDEAEIVILGEKNLCNFNNTINNNNNDNNHLNHRTNDGTTAALAKKGKMKERRRQRKNAKNGTTNCGIDQCHRRRRRSSERLITEFFHHPQQQQLNAFTSCA